MFVGIARITGNAGIEGGRGVHSLSLQRLNML